MRNFYDEKMQKEISDLASSISYEVEGGIMPKLEVEEKLKLFASNIRTLAHKEIEQEIFDIKSKWERMEDPSASIAADVLISAIKERRKDLSIFRETLEVLTEG